MNVATKLLAAAALAVVLVGGVGAADKPGYIGVKIAIDQNVKGFVVQELNAEGPAAKAGLKERDVILKVDGKEVDTLANFVKSIEAHKPGDKITLTVKRDNKEQEIKITAGAKPDPKG